MPSIESRSADISGTYAKTQPGPPVNGAPAMPTPHPPYVGRHPRMISSLPAVFATQDAALRQFYGQNIPGRRVPSLA